MSALVSVSVARAKEIMASNAAFVADPARELVAAANTIVSLEQAIVLNNGRIAELEKSFEESERQRRLAIDMVAIALKIEVL